MRNIRRFQRTILVVFIGINTFVFTSMKGYAFSDRFWLTLAAMAIATVGVLTTAYFTRTQREKKKGFNDPQRVG